MGKKKDSGSLRAEFRVLERDLKLEMKGLREELERRVTQDEKDAKQASKKASEFKNSTEDTKMKHLEF